MPNNFAVTLHDGEQKQKAMRAFRKNYKLDFIEIDDVDEWDEHKVEAKIVENIKRFIMALGADFSYMELIFCNKTIIRTKKCDISHFFELKSVINGNVASAY